MVTIPTDNPVAAAVTTAIHQGRVEDLHRLLSDHSWLATARLGDDTPGAMTRALLHVATDWPGRYPRIAETVRALVDAGADVNARFQGPHEETPLHWAASSDDVAALDALLDAGADIEAAGAVLRGGAPLADARGFKQWNVAQRLRDRGATTTLMDAATLGLDDRVAALLATTLPTDQIDFALWGACQGGRRGCAEQLITAGAAINRRPPWSDQTPWAPPPPTAHSTSPGGCTAKARDQRPNSARALTSRAPPARRDQVLESRSGTLPGRGGLRLVEGRSDVGSLLMFVTFEMAVEPSADGAAEGGFVVGERTWRTWRELR